MLLRLVSPGACGSGGTTGPWKEGCGMRSDEFKAVRWNVWDVFCVRFHGAQGAAKAAEPRGVTAVCDCAQGGASGRDSPPEQPQ